MPQRQEQCDGMADMTDKPDCERCRRIKAAIEQGLPPHAAREENGWDECSQDDCPMLPKPYRLKTCSGGGFGHAA
jgi:hypothetical protein